MDVDAERRAAGHILTELGFDVGRTDEGVRGSAQVVPEMWVPGTRACVDPGHVGRPRVRARRHRRVGAACR